MCNCVLPHPSILRCSCNMVHAPKQRWKASLPEHPGQLPLQTLPRVYHFVLELALVLVKIPHRLPCLRSTTAFRAIQHRVIAELPSHCLHTLHTYTTSLALYLPFVYTTHYHIVTYMTLYSHCTTVLLYIVTNYATSVCFIWDTHAMLCNNYVSSVVQCTHTHTYTCLCVCVCTLHAAHIHILHTNTYIYAHKHSSTIMQTAEWTSKC